MTSSIRSCLLAALLCSGPALAADGQPCQYIELAKVPVSYTGPGLTITMEGRIDGTPAQILVDTGASRTYLTRTGTSKRGLRLRPTSKETIGVGGYSRVYTTRLKDFSIGPSRSTHGWLYVIGDTGTVPSYDAIAGAPFLLQTDVEFSLADKQIRFFQPSNCDNAFLGYWDPEAVVIPFEAHSGSSPNPHFTVEVNGTRLKAMIDSGASVTTIDSVAARRAGLKLDAPGVERLPDVVGIGSDRVASWSTVVERLVIGRETVNNAEIAVIETDGILDVDLLLGADFLRAHRVLFAMKQKKIYISYIGGEPFKQRRSIEPWMQQEADSGNPDAQYYLARIHASGWGVPKDPAKAAAWLEKAAALGHPHAGLQAGRKRMAERRWPEAVALLRGALDKLPTDRAGALWLYLARLNSGQPELARQELEAAFAPDERDEWPGPIADFYLGRIDAAALLKEAGSQSKLARQRTCSATRFMMNLYQAQGNREQALAMRAALREQCLPAPGAGGT